MVLGNNLEGDDSPEQEEQRLKWLKQTLKMSPDVTSYPIHPVEIWDSKVIDVAERHRRWQEQHDREVALVNRQKIEAEIARLQGEGKLRQEQKAGNPRLDVGAVLDHLYKGEFPITLRDRFDIGWEASFGKSVKPYSTFDTVYDAVRWLGRQGIDHLRSHKESEARSSDWIRRMEWLLAGSPADA